jgi:hypothetical protein
VKLKECVQNSKGNQFAACYNINGEFRMRIFDQEKMTAEKAKRNDINFTELFGLNVFIAPIEEFPEPFMNCCFVEDDKLFVQLFHN